MIHDKIMFYKDYSQLGIRCFCCNYYNHIALDCPMVHVTVSKERVIRDLLRSEPTVRKPFPRFQKKFKAIKNLQKLINATIKLQRTTTLDVSRYSSFKFVDLLKYIN